MLQGSFSGGYLKESKGNSREVSKVFQVVRVFQGSFKEVSRIFQGCFQGVSRKIEGCSERFKVI